MGTGQVDAVHVFGNMITVDLAKGFTADYPLNTTTGNRPARVAPSGCKAGQPCYYVTPQYIFNGDTPKPGENNRAALARNVTGECLHG